MMDITTALTAYSAVVSTIDIVKDLCPLYLKKKAETEVFIEIYKDHFKKCLLEIPEEHRQEPKNSILWPALETSIFYLEEKEYRDMFTKLISSACDNRKNKEMHACFLEIIKQMDPIDAILLKEYLINKTLPLVEYRVQTNTGYRIFKTNIYLKSLDQDLSMYSSAIANLERLGLIKTKSDQGLTNSSVYEIYEKHNDYLVNKRFFEDNNHPTLGKNCKLLIAKGFSMLTPLGEDFVKVCVE